MKSFQVADFNAFNREAASLFGASGNAYQATLDAAAKGGTTGISFGSFGFSPTLLLLPFLAFYLLWPVWGATLYGEVRGAGDFRKVLNGMLGGLWVTIGLAIVFVTLERMTKKDMETFERAVMKPAEVQECFLIAGSNDYLVRVTYRDSTDLERIHTDILMKLPGVIRTQSTLVLRTVKKTTAFKV